MSGAPQHLGPCEGFAPANLWKSWNSEAGNPYNVGKKMKSVTILILGVVGVVVAAASWLSKGSPNMLAGFSQQEGQVRPGKDANSPKRKDKVVKTEAEWKKQLTPMQYKILRAQGTEAAFCGVFYDNHKKGTYYCVGCGLPLFKSEAKFDSGTGWPSFFQPYSKENIWTRVDDSYGMHREEVLCARCDGHLGHVFDDGPSDKGGLRFCINSEILTFKEEK